MNVLSYKNKPKLPAILFMVSLLFMSGCASWTKATASRQWIEPPDETVWTNLMTIRERSLVAGDAITIADAAAVYVALGTVRSDGPANTTRQVERTANGWKIGVKTDNSTWIGGMFKGLWSTATTVGDWVTQVAAAAAP